MTKELQAERRKTLDALNEKNDLLNNQYVLDNQVKELIDVVKSYEMKNESDENEKYGIIKKNELLHKRNLE